MTPQYRATSIAYCAGRRATDVPNNNGRIDAAGHGDDHARLTARLGEAEIEVFCEHGAHYRVALAGCNYPSRVSRGTNNLNFVAGHAGIRRDRQDSAGTTTARQTVRGGLSIAERPLIPSAAFRPPSHLMARPWHSRRTTRTGPCSGVARVCQAPAASRPACQNAASSRVAMRKVVASSAKRAEPPRPAASPSSAATSARMNAWYSSPAYISIQGP